MIKLENIVKIYEGNSNPAVDNLSVEIPNGKICILIGPSGCGKTTLLRMINGLISPTGGEIFINDNDITEVDQVELRRNMGYVIQGTGLFPHWTIAENISVVPKLLKWPKDKIENVVNNMLILIGLDPDEYKNRYPKALSGGQVQRVGVARALAADPPIMLMDEPFGAADPITRSKLQNEFLYIQEKIRKTIVFVTHDIDEAIKMGDLIAILKDGKLIQYGTPDDILSHPENEFVSEFVGSDRTLKRLGLIKVRDVMTRGVEIVKSSDPIDKVKEMIKRVNNNFLYVINEKMEPRGYVLEEDLEKGKNLKEIIRTMASPVNPEDTLKTALSNMMALGVGTICVVNNKNEFIGEVTLNVLTRLISNSDRE